MKQKNQIWIHAYILQNYLGFLNGVKTLENTADYEAYLKFVNVYGTHFLVTTHMGAKYVEETELTKASKEHMEQENININIAASYSTMFHLGIDNDNKIDKKMVERFVPDIRTS